MKVRRKIRSLQREEEQAERRRIRNPRGREFWPLTAPGMPAPGPNFLAMAAALGDDTVVKAKTKTKEAVFEPGETLVELYERALREPGFSMNVEVRPGRHQPVTFVPGHIWGQHGAAWAKAMVDGGPLPRVDGPHRADVMVIGKMPWKEEVKSLRNLVGASGEVLLELLDAVHVKGVDKWYVTNLVKFAPPEGATGLRAAWVNDCRILLAQELRIVRPKYVLCLGADASKALLGAKYNVGYMDGRVVPYEFPVHLSRDDEPKFHTAQVMAVLHPVEAVREQSKARTVERGLGRFAHLIQGADFVAGEQDLDHRIIDTYEDAVEWAEEVDAYFAGTPKARRLVAWDAEWQGQHPMNAGSYLRTVQASWAPKCAVCFKIAHAGGKTAFRDRDGKPAVKRLMKLLQRFSRDKRAVGHFLVADLEWLTYYGFDPTRDCRAPLDPDAKGRPAWLRLRRGEGWLDTAMMAHSIEETAPLGLEALTMRYTTVPRYDIPLEDWKKEYCAARGIKTAALEGYGDCPDKVLVPYACLHRDSLVQLADGRWEKIGVLVRGRYAGKVKALVGGKVVDAPVTNWHRHDVGQKDWFTLRTASTASGRWGALGPRFTPDHKVLTRRGKVRVDALVVGRDAIATDEREFSSEQLSVVLGSLLGDGGFTRKNAAGVGFGFSQRTATSAYVDWKADVLSTHGPARRTRDGYTRYELPFSRYVASLAERFPTHPVEVHAKRKAVITAELLNALGSLGLAVWYQDDGTLVTDKRDGRMTSRIYCKIGKEEQDRVVAWLSARYGVGVAYDAVSHFISIGGEAFAAFHDAVWRYMHPAMAYKTPRSAPRVPYRAGKEGRVFYETVTGVERYDLPEGGRGHGVRYCLTVEGAGNFLTKAGFVSNCYDADATLRLALELEPLLDYDYDGNCCWESCWEKMTIQPVILTIHQNGIKVDRRKIDRLTGAFVTARAAQEDKIRDWAQWPEFNIRSVQQVKEFLFGARYNGKYDKKTGDTVRIRPKGAASLGVEPLLDTSKPPRRWDDLVARGLEKYATPGTGKAILAILAQENFDRADQINWLRDYRFLDQVLKSVLRPPLEDDQGDWLIDDDGQYEYDAGLAYSIDDDGRVRTHLYPTAETGRWKSSRPNLQNISKSRDPDYKRILGDQYKDKLRSVLIAEDGFGLVEFDYTGAELYGMALMAGDAAMIDHAQRSLYPDEGYDDRGKRVKGGKSPHPKYYDIHSNVAVLAFQLKVNDHVHEKDNKSSPYYGKTAAEILGLPVGAVCPATKFALKVIGRTHFRTLAKNVIFGIAYGRGAKAIALSAKEQGVDVTPDDAQMVIDAIFAMYPNLQPFFEEAKIRAIRDRWLAHCFGGLRRFIAAREDKLAGEFERQAMNFPIQGMIASAVNRGLARLHSLIFEYGLQDDVRLLLQIHDAGLLEVRNELIGWVVEKLIPYAMVECVPIYPTTLDGVPTGAGPFHLGLDIMVEKEWGGRKYTAEECERYGIPAKYAA